MSGIDLLITLLVLIGVFLLLRWLIGQLAPPANSFGMYVLIVIFIILILLMLVGRVPLIHLRL